MALTRLNKSDRLCPVSSHAGKPPSGYECVLALLVALLAIASPTRAQEEGGAPGTARDDREVLLPVEDDDAPEPSGNIDEMIVQASGRDDFLKDLSISQTSFSAAEIKSLRIQNIADLSEYTPNLEINTRSSASNPTLFIRGIGLKDYNANAAGAVAVYQDGVNINSPAIQLGQLFDTEELFVLRGPQGDLNGRNATAGAIMINSVLPDGELNVSSSLTYGNYNAVYAEGAIGFPIIEDLLSGRVAFTANFRDGITKNNCAGWDPEANGFPLLSEETIRAAWEFNGFPDHSTRPRNNHPRHSTESHAGHPHVAGNDTPGNRYNPGKFPNQNNANAESDSQGRPLVPDGVCIMDSPGYLEFSQVFADTWIPNIGNESWVEDTGAKTPEDFANLKHRVNNIKNWATRGILRFQPDVDDGMDWVLNFHGGQNLGDSTRLQSLRTQYVHNEGDPFFIESLDVPSSEVVSAERSGFKFEGVREVDGVFALGSDANNLIPGGRGGDDPDAGFYDRDGLELLNAWGTSLRGIWDTGPVVVTSLTGYEWYERTIDDEGDAVPTKEFPAIYEDGAWQVSQELRATGEGERYQWLVGAFFLHDELDSSNLFPGLRQRRIEQTFAQKLTSAAGYGNGRYWVLDEVYVDAGLRYNFEKKDFSLASTILSLASDGTTEAFPEELVSESWTGVTGGATLAWEPGGDWMYDARLDHLNLYVKYGRGMKGGHFNAALTIQGNVREKQRITAVEPEFIDSVEVGFKSRWLQDRLIVNFAAFRYWYQDLQVFDYINEANELPIQQLLNSDANVLGAELEIMTRPFPGLLIQFGGGWLDSEFVDFKVEKATAGSRGTSSVELVEFDYSGHPLISAPTWSFSSVVEYQIPLGRWGSLVPQYTVSYRSKVYLDPQMLDPISQEPYWLHNARLAYRTPDGRFEIAGWVENFLNERYKIDVFDLSLGTNSILEVWNEPRMFGVTLSAYF